MNRREFLASAGQASAGAAALALPRVAGGQAALRKPNIIFIMADDLGYANLGCCGAEHILTPHIDQLAAEGIRFTDCYAGSAVCAPSRSVLMTGQHAGHTRVRGNASGIGKGRVPLETEDVTVAEVLKQAGYTTGIVGKWGLGEPGTTGVPDKQGFDYWFGYLNQARAHQYYTDYLWRNEAKVSIKENEGGKQVVYSHDLMTEEALAFVRRSKDKPFFLYLPYTIPHQKLQVPDLGPYKDKAWPEKTKIMPAMVTRMDRDVGRLMALLKELGIDDDTVVFFTSDNGGAFTGKFFGGSWGMFKSNGVLRGGKGSLYEGGIRVPMIVRWPGKVKAGTVSDHPWAFWDFLPTAGALAGAQPPDSIDGISMVPAILDQADAPRHELMYWEYRTNRFQQAVRMGDWKAIRFGTKERMRLHNLKSDPTESKDVAKEHPEVVAKIEAHMATARTESYHWPAMEHPQPRKKRPRKRRAAK